MSWWTRLRYDQEKEVLKVLAKVDVPLTAMEIVDKASGRIDAYHCLSTLIELRDYKPSKEVASINMGDHFCWCITQAGLVRIGQ